MFIWQIKQQPVTIASVVSVGTVSVNHQSSIMVRYIVGVLVDNRHCLYNHVPSPFPVIQGTCQLTHGGHYCVLYISCGWFHRSVTKSQAIFMYWQTSWLSVSQHIGRYIDWVSVKSLFENRSILQTKMSNDSRPGPGIGCYVVQVSMIYWWTVSNIDRQSNDLRLTDRKTVVADSAGLSQELLSDTLPQLTKKAIDISRYICRHQQKNMWFHIPTQSQTGY